MAVVIVVLVALITASAVTTVQPASVAAGEFAGELSVHPGAVLVQADDLDGFAS
ncbi:hypothetical protein [Amycolatopsis sp. BJA-103]|uniref:hypothetical protein n=1 Tax=Amycolatopsis sp. BJA-103 TaxID=1911175 RepID=UPI00143D911B|nr:hypothetical protein [Amycolatopsis sp. BJA-103]